MRCWISRMFSSMVVTWLLFCGIQAVQAVEYGMPEGGWLFTYDGGPNFVELFTHNNGSDAWDGSGLSDGLPGGAESFTQDGVTFLRTVDTGNPQDHGFVSGDPSNRKIKFVRGVDFDFDPLDFDGGGAGVTMYFRTRITPGSDLADIQVLPASGATPFPWPAEGRGQTDLRFSGSGWIGIDTTFGTVNFTLDYGDNSQFYLEDGLAMNDLIAVGFPTPGASNSGSGQLNLHPLTNLTEWQDLWITIEPLDPLDFDNWGTNRVTVYSNGSMTGEMYEVTAGTWNDAQAEAGQAAIHFGPSYTDTYSAVDLDLFYIKEGIFEPVPPDVACIEGDVNCDGSVDTLDLTILLANWTGICDPGTCFKTAAEGDTDGDGDVDSADLTRLLAAWTGAQGSVLGNVSLDPFTANGFDNTAALVAHMNLMFAGQAHALAAGGGTDVTMIPEPTGARLLAAGSLLLLRRRSKAERATHCQP